MFLAILGVIFVIVSGSTHVYHVAIVGFMGAGIVLTSSACANWFSVITRNAALKTSR